MNLPPTQAAPGPGGGAQHFVTAMDIPPQWWHLFRSGKLDALVARALAANPNLDAARAALRQAHELTAAQWTAFLPLVQADASATRYKNANNAIATPVATFSPYYSLYTGQVSVSYLPDVFGATRRAVESARAQEEATRFQMEATYLTLASNVVVTAIQAASVRRQIDATMRLKALQHELTEKTRGQFALGTASELDVLTQQAAEAATAQNLPPLQKQLAQTNDALAALLGQYRPAGQQSELRLEDLTLPRDLPVSLPSQLVSQRPDIRQAEANLHAATAEVGVAIANMLPQISLNAAIGTSGLNTGQLFSPGFGFWSYGTSLTQTIFDAGALLHKRRAADAAMHEAAAQYRATVIAAFQNVTDSLRALQYDADALRISSDADRVARRSFDLARRQFGLGSVSEVALMATEQTYQQAELSLAQAQASRYADTAGLFEALGGGWWNRPTEAQ
jgi:NodT family efflux transporter outer membrane factor (OMF) lipoprotein